MAVVKAAPARVTVSLAEPPVMVSVLATVAVLAKLPKVRVSLPAARSMDALAATAPRVTVSAADAAEQGCEFLTVPVLATLARVSLLAPAARSTAMPVGEALWRG